MIWPYSIAASIIFIFGACVATIVVATKLPVEKSDTYMMGYHEADNSANELISARIEFDKKYKIAYITDGMDLDNSSIKYKVTDLDSNAVDNAKVEVVLTRPNSRQHDQELTNPTVQDGIYTFDSINLELKGRWDVMARVSVGDLQRYYNVKTDTRNNKVVEY